MYVECLCCFTLLCPDNWCPSYGIKDIVDEFIRVTSWKARIIEKIWCKKVQEQRLPKLFVEYYPIYKYL